jgi:hypothetical protein
VSCFTIKDELRSLNGESFRGLLPPEGGRVGRGVCLSKTVFIRENNISCTPHLKLFTKLDFLAKLVH